MAPPVSQAAFHSIDQSIYRDSHVFKRLRDNLFGHPEPEQETTEPTTPTEATPDAAPETTTGAQPRGSQAPVSSAQPAAHADSVLRKQPAGSLHGPSAPTRPASAPVI